jgi:hypothetical protein
VEDIVRVIPDAGGERPFRMRGVMVEAVDERPEAFERGGLELADDAPELEVFRKILAA